VRRAPDGHPTREPDLAGVAARRIDRRHVLRSGALAGGMGLLGVSSSLLPSASAAASDLGLTGVPTSSLVAHLDASLPGDSPSTVWADRSGNGHTGSIPTGVSHRPADGPTPAHYSFDGSETAAVPIAGGVTIVGSSEVPPTAYTKMVWFRRDRTDLIQNLISSADTGAPHFFWFKEPSHLRLFAGHDNTATAPGATLDVGADVWTFGAVTFSTSDGLRIFTNSSDRTWSDAAASQEIRYADYSTAPSGAMSFQVGGFGSSANYRFEGDIATVVVHGRALGPEEVQAYYAATVDRFHPAA
jgi:hypothetical protein